MSTDPPSDIDGGAPVTAVIPCHNAAPFLAEAIASVRAQTRAVTELIVVDDHSTDDSAAIAEALGATVIRHERCRGNGAARNTGLRAATTELVALLDADDIWLASHLATVVPLLERHPSATAAFSALRLFGAGVGPTTPLHTPRLPDGPPADVFAHCLKHDVGQPSACVLRRADALAIGGFDESMPLGVDFDMHLRLAAKYPLVCTWEVTVLYRQHAGQISSNKPRRVPWCFRSRARAWRALVDAGDASAADAAAAIINEAWRDALQFAWDARRTADVAEILALAPILPPDEALRRRWARRLMIPAPLLTLWFRGGERLRSPLRRLLKALEKSDA